jgi:hypothetical protein
MGFLGDLLGFGGDESNSSTSSQSTSNQTAYNTDKRNVVSEQAIGLSGDGNVVDRSSSNLSQWFDSSDHSVQFSDSSNRSTVMNDSRNLSTMLFDSRNLSTAFTDSSDRSTQFTDNSNRSTENRTSFVDSSDRSTYFNDTSNRSTDNRTSFVDSSDRSTYFNDTSNRSTAMNSNNLTSFVDNSDRSITTVGTDYGSVNASIGLAGAMGSRAFDLSGLSITGALDNLKLQSQTSLEATRQAFDLVRSSGANNLASSAQMLGMATSAIERTASAFQEADDGGQKKTVMYALAAVAVIGVAFAMNR